jgi:hypothetical protein
VLHLGGWSIKRVMELKDVIKLIKVDRLIKSKEVSVECLGIFKPP